MDVVLGVAVTGPVARLALIGTGADAAGVIDQSVVDLANNPVEQLAETVVGTNRLLAGENHRLVGTRVCWTDTPKADQLRQALEDSGVHNVALLTESQAVKSLMRAAGRPGAALLFDEATATLSLVDSAVTDEDAPPTLLAQGPLTGGDDDGRARHIDGQTRRPAEHHQRRLPGGRIRGSRPGCRPASRDVDDASADRRGPDLRAGPRRRAGGRAAGAGCDGDGPGGR